MKLYVGNLPFSFSQEDLEELFSSFTGVDSVRLISDRDTKRSKGYGFVEFSDDDQARAAIDKLHQSTVGTRPIVVNEARPQEQRKGPPSRSFNNNKRGFGRS